MADKWTGRSDAQLLRDSEDAAAFAELYRRHVEAVYGWFRRRLEWAASDLTAETFAQTWLSRRRFRDERDGSALPWLLGIARNVLHDSVRRDRIETRARAKLGLPLDLAAEDGYVHVDERLSPRRALADALHELPAHERRALELRVVDGAAVRRSRRAPRDPPSGRAAARLTRPAPPRRFDIEGGPVTGLPPSLERYESELERAIRRHRRRRSRRLAVRFAALAATAGAIAFAALSALPAGKGPAPASAVQRAASVVAAADGGILHIVMRVTSTGADGTQVGRRETWQLLSPPYDSREVSTPQEPSREFGTVDGRPEVYNPMTNTIATLAPGVDLPAGTRPPQPEGKRLRVAMLSMLKSGEAHEDGHVTIDGRDAIRIVAADTVLFVDAHTSQPIEWRSVGENPHAVITTRIETYERLRRRRRTARC